MLYFIYCKMTIQEDSQLFEESIQKIEPKKVDKRLNQGIKLLAIGAILGFLSCVMSIWNPIPAIYYIVLYGVTSVAILLILAGLYYIFE